MDCGCYNFGDYVIYTPDNGNAEIGRVLRDEGRDFLSVCFTDGCGSAFTNRFNLRLATQEEINNASINIGHYRFADSCPDYDCDACFMCNHDPREMH